MNTTSQIVDISKVNELLQLMTRDIQARLSGNCDEIGNDSREKVLEQVIHDTIQDLDKTKSTFKSKRLAEIRGKLISALKNN